MFAPDVIVHPTDFSESADEAFRYALHLAQRHDADLHVLHVVASLGVDPIRGAFESGIDDEAFLADLEEEAQQELGRYVRTAEETGVTVTRTLRRDPDPDDAICDYVRDTGAGLVVMGTHGRRALSRIMLGSVAESVVHHAPCSVLTVRRTEDRQTDPASVDRVLTPIDLSEYAVPLLQASRDVATAFEATMDVLHVVEPLPLPVPLVGGFTLNDLISEPTVRAQEHVQTALRRAGLAADDARVHVEEGHAAATILDVAGDLDADLLCIASHGLSGVTRMLVGSVTARVVRRAPCPVLTLRVQPEEADAA